jgi:hypothetical protein
VGNLIIRIFAIDSLIFEWIFLLVFAFLPFFGGRKLFSAIIEKNQKDDI